MTLNKRNADQYKQMLCVCVCQQICDRQTIASHFYLISISKIFLAWLVLTDERNEELY